MVSAVVSRRALEPSIEAIAPFEMAGAQSANPVRAYVYLHFRMLAGVLGRYDEVQHTREDSLVEQGISLACLAWETKTN